MTRASIIASLLLAACGGASPGRSSIESTVQGFASTTVPATSTAFISECRGQTIYSLNLTFGQTVAACNGLSTPSPGPLQLLEIVIENSPTPLTAGTFPIASPETAAVVAAILNAEISDGTSRRFWRATSGTLTIDAVSADAVSGSFEAGGIVDVTASPVENPVQGTLSGRFSGSACPAVHPICD